MTTRPKPKVKKKRRKASGGKKGNPYERAMCVKLSQWYCGRDDGLWRTAGSGARATVRGRKGKQTSNHCGDICSTHPDTKSLTDCITFELKKGYNKHTIHELMDGKGSKQEWIKWLKKAILSRDNAGSMYWAIIARRDYMHDMIVMEEELYDALCNISKKFIGNYPVCRIHLMLGKGEACHFVMMRLETFLYKVYPSDIKRLG